MTLYCIEFIVIDPQRPTNGQRLIILDDLPEKKLNEIESIPENDPARLALIEKFYKRYGFGDVPNYGYDGVKRPKHVFGCYTRVIDRAADLHDGREVSLCH